jgi:uncharacterized protein YggU (UPF0235/DUF167 family)
LTEAGEELRVVRTPGGVALFIQVTPRARRPGVGGARGDALRVGVREAPIEGRANAACVRALAEALGVRARDVKLDPAARGRRKRVEVVGDAERLARRLAELAQSDTLR